MSFTTEEPFLDEGTQSDEVDPVKKFFTDNIWLPIVGCVIILFVVAGLSFQVIKNRKRKAKRYNYWALDDSGSPSKVELERRMENVLQRDTALLSCSFYLRSKKEYKLIDHLAEIGSRYRKQWFLLRERKNKREKLLSIMPYSIEMVLPFTKTTLKSLQEICEQLQHPYILPMDDIAFQEDQGHVVIVQPCCKQGSLKDYIYSSRWQDNFDDKYNIQTHGLNLSDVKLFGKQILEAMLYLRGRGFPWNGHLHTGNIMLEDGVCRLTGYENTLLGCPSKMKPLLRRSAQNDMKLLDVHSFGHVIFEMLMGEELESAAPDANHYRTINNTLIVEFLSFIFTRHGGEYPSLKKINRHQFFSGAWLAEVSLFPPQHTPLPPHLKTVLRTIKKGKGSAKRNGNSRGAVSRASSYGSLNSQASSAISGPANENTPLMSYSLTPIIGSDANQSERPIPPPKPHKLKKSKKIKSMPEVLVDIHDPKEERLSERKMAINGEKSALMAEIRRGIELRKTYSGDKSAPTV